MCMYVYIEREMYVCIYVTCIRPNKRKELYKIMIKRNMRKKNTRKIKIEIKDKQ